MDMRPSIHGVTDLRSEGCWPANGGCLTLNFGGDPPLVVDLYLGRDEAAIRRCVALHYALGGTTDGICRSASHHPEPAAIENLVAECIAAHDRTPPAGVRETLRQQMLAAMGTLGLEALE